MTLQPPTIDARVIQTAHGFKVIPDYVPKRAGYDFTILNMTDTTVHVNFLDLPTNPHEDDIASRDFRTFTILSTALPGTYPYHVEIVLTDSFAKQIKLRASGGSDPSIIIDF